MRTVAVVYPRMPAVSKGADAPGRGDGGEVVSGRAVSGEADAVAASAPYARARECPAADHTPPGDGDRRTSRSGTDVPRTHGMWSPS